MQRLTNFDLTDYNSYRIQASCTVACIPSSADDIQQFFADYSDNYILLGSGHNIILTKKRYERPFLIMTERFGQVSVDASTSNMTAQAGTKMDRLSEVAAQHGLSGLEVFYDIPSSLGGAVVMNAGASGEDIDQLIVSVEYLDLTDGQIKVAQRRELDFEYRNGTFQRNPHLIVLAATMALRPVDRQTIRNKMESVKAARWAKQPREFPNAGSVFKRPMGYYVGKLVQDLSLKGLRVGGAKISEKHGGFIINAEGRATGADVLAVIQTVRERVREAYGVELEIEQRII